MTNSYKLAERINSDVNASVKYKTDLGQYGVPEFWTVAGKYGDCEDYALAKRSALLHAGWPKDKLGLCVCYTQSGEGHCVLWVESTQFKLWRLVDMETVTLQIDINKITTEGFEAGDRRSISADVQAENNGTSI